MMNPRLAETFRRHRALLAVPVLVVPVIALWMVLGTPVRYEAGATLWLDTPPPDHSSVTHPDPALTTPAAQAQSLLFELLRTRTFRARVAERGPLAAYLADGPPAGWSPTALLQRLRKPPSFDKRVEDALAGRIRTFPEGPQVLTLELQSEDPAVAAGTLQALVDEFQAERAALVSLRAQGSLAYYEQQLESARLSEEAIVGQIADFRRTHPTASTSDPELSALREAQEAAAAAVVEATNALHRATVAAANPSIHPSSLRVLDAPVVPPDPVRGRKAIALAVVGGIFAGAVVALAAALALTARAARADEAEAAAGAEPALAPAEPPDVIVAPPGANGTAPTANGAARPRRRPRARPRKTAAR